MKYNKKDYDEKMTQLTVKSETMFAVISNQLNTLSSSSTHKDTSNPPEPITVVTANRRAPPLEGGHSRKMVACGLSKMISAHQNNMSSSSRHKSKDTLLWISRTYLNTPRRASMWLLDSGNTSLLVTIP